ncbi:MAG: hypothetical protein RR075_01705 [Pygmaiobacter sp.]
MAYREQCFAYGMPAQNVMFGSVGKTQKQSGVPVGVMMLFLPELCG